MGVIQRFKDIMSANINAMLDKAENPEKMIDQYMRNLEDDLGKVKAETASVMAEEARAKRAYDEALAEVEKYQKYAEKAVAAGNDNDARVFLQSKKTAQSKLEGLKLTYDTAAANAQKMRQMHDKLVNDISDLRARKETIKAKVAVAKAQERVNQVGSSLRGVSNNMSAFDRMEEKANKMLDTANAMAQLNESADTNVDDLARKYDLDDVAGTSDIDDELAKDVNIDGIETLADLETYTKEQIKNKKQTEVESKFSDDIFNAVIENTPLEVPEAMIETETQTMLREVEQNLSQQGLNMELFQQLTGKTMEDMKAEMSEQAEKRVKFNLILAEIAKAENIEISDEEVDDEIKEIATYYGREFDEVKTIFEAQMGQIKSDLATRKAVQLIKDNVK